MEDLEELERSFFDLLDDLALSLLRLVFSSLDFLEDCPDSVRFFSVLDFR